MFCSIRQYEGCTDVEELQATLNGELLPQIRDMAGFQSYVLIEHDDGDVTSISMFDTQEQAEEANSKVADIVAGSLAELLPEAPVIMIGEVLIDTRR